MIGLGNAHALTLAASCPLALPFDPLAILSMGEWFDYRTLAAVVGGGSPVNALAGRKGLYTATATARPTYIADVCDGRGGLLFDGVDDCLFFNLNNGDMWGPDGNHEAGMVVKSPPSVATINALITCGGAQSISIQVQPTYARFNWYSTSNSNFGAPFDVQDGDWHVLRFTMKPTGPTTYVDGMEVGFGSDIYGFPGSWNTGAGNAFIGSGAFGAADFWQGGFRHILSFKAPLSDEMAAAFTSYLMTA